MNNNPNTITKEAKDRIELAQIEHDVQKQLKGFCSNLFCRFCEAKKAEDKHMRLG